MFLILYEIMNIYFFYFTNTLCSFPDSGLACLCCSMYNIHTRFHISISFHKGVKNHLFGKETIKVMIACKI